ALAVRDGHCVFPGCDRPASWCDAHHVTRHTDGGPTTIDNLALLCRHHHGVIHRTGWHMTPNPQTDAPSRDGADGDQTSFFTITTPDGARLPTHHDRPPRQDQQPRQSRPAPA
ncbi:MAG: HNH endonuclease, partial [Microthrixaceae bacterium]|nr:HNH endonuclease [Microthrixaceae bacterium]